MQNIMPPVGADAQVIQSYGPDGLRIGNAMYGSHVLIMPTVTLPWNGELTLEALEPFFATNPPPEIVLIGTGKRHTMISSALRAEFKRRGIGLDSMDTGAACRTFNVLLGESRRVAAALLLPE